MPTALPLRSRPVRAGGFLLPCWWDKALLALAALCVLAVMAFQDMVPAWLTDDLPRGLSRLLPSSLEFDHIDPGVFFAVFAGLFELLLIFLLAHLRYKRSAETVIHPDRIESRQGDAPAQVARWRDILRQEERDDDVWLEQQRSGRTTYDMIRFDVLDQGKRRAVRLFRHLNPLGLGSPAYRNVKALRQAFLLSMLRAQPSLRVAADVYALCEVDPKTLRSSPARKWAGWLNNSIASIASLLCLSVVLQNVDESFEWLLVAKLFGATLAGFAVAWMAGSWLLSQLFVAPQDPRAVAERTRLLGGGKGTMRSTRDYPLADDDVATREQPVRRAGLEWVEALTTRQRPDEECPYDVLEGSDWSRLLAVRPELAHRCPWDKLDGEDWSSLLAEQPALAEHCSWEKLSPSDWATLLASQPQFFDVGKEHFRWSDLDGSDWSELLGTQPQFGEYCDFSKLDGLNWGLLLREQPQFADRCSWEKLEEDDWQILLAAQPQFASARRTGGRPRK